MKGLFLDNLYKTADEMKILLPILLIIGAIIIVFIEDQLIVQFYIITVFLSISICALLSIRKDAEAKWTRYEIILPVRRKTIIQCKYISFLLWVIVSAMMAVMFTVIIIIFKGNIYFDSGIRDILTIFILSVALVLQIASIFYMGLYFLGLDKSQILMILSVIVSISLIGLLAGVLNKKGVSLEVGRIIVFGISVFFLGVSYNITKLLYYRREF